MPVILILVLLLVGAALIVSGIAVLFGLGCALVTAGAFALVAAQLLRRSLS